MKPTQPFPYQHEDIRRINRDFDGRFLNANELGLGKTFESFYYAEHYLPTEPAGPVVCVVPAHLKINWENEARKHLGRRLEILRGQRVPVDKQPPINPNHTYVINYDILCPPNWNPSARPPKDSWLRFLMDQKPRLLIADEGHYLSNHLSMRTRAVRRLARITPHVHILTGTPISNKPIQLWSILNILRPDLYPSRADFCEEYSYARRQWWGIQYRGARNLDKLHDQLLRHVMIRRLKKDVLHDLPPIQYSMIPMEVDLGEYHKAEADFVGWLSSQSIGDARAAAKAAELTKMHHLKQMAGQLKLKAVIDWIADFLESGDAKLLVGAIHYAVTEPLMEVFRKCAVLVDGRLSDRQKHDRTERFNHDPSCRLMFGNLQAAGTGWNCSSTSDEAIIELPWVPGEVVQFAGRIHGIGRGVPGSNAHVRFLVAHDTIEHDLCRALQIKQQWQAEAIDGVVGSKDLPVHDMLLALMRARHERAA